MLLRSLAALALVLVLAPLRSSAEPAVEDNVVVLTPDNFDDWISKHDHAIVEFYAPWCGHCQSLAPEWAAAAAKTSKLKPAVPLAKVDADAHQELAQRFDVSGYPTIKTFKKGVADEYDGPREAKGIVSYAKKFAGITGSATSIVRIKTGDEASSITSSSAAVVGVFREPVTASAMFKTFTEVAAELSSYIETPIKVVYSASYKEDPVAAAYGVKAVPAILYFPKGSSTPVSMPIPRKREEFTEEALVAWIEEAVETASA